MAKNVAFLVAQYLQEGARTAVFRAEVEHPPEHTLPILIPSSGTFECSAALLCTRTSPPSGLGATFRLARREATCVDFGMW
jgi:hypothetical protein